MILQAKFPVALWFWPNKVLPCPPTLEHELDFWQHLLISNMCCRALSQPLKVTIGVSGLVCVLYIFKSLLGILKLMFANNSNRKVDILKERKKKKHTSEMPKLQFNKSELPCFTAHRFKSSVETRC